MSRPKDAGTRWESEIVRRAQDYGLVSTRHAEGGSSDVADVWIGSPIPELGDITAVAWKRLNGDGKHRTPDGERDVVVLRTEDFLQLAADANQWCSVGIHIEAKARQNLNVTRELYKARSKVARAIQRREIA